MLLRLYRGKLLREERRALAMGLEQQILTRRLQAGLTKEGPLLHVMV